VAPTGEYNAVAVNFDADSRTLGYSDATTELSLHTVNMEHLQNSDETIG